jgi:diacylglycerol kinase (ATP)
MRALLLHNPTAGTRAHSAEALSNIVGDAGYSVTYCSTKGGSFKGVLKQRTDLIVIAGGDGTITKVVRKLPDIDIPLAILPLGTANNIARSLGIDGDADALLRLLHCHDTVQLDIGIASGPWGRRRFVEGVGLGALSHLMVEGSKPPAAERTRIGRERLRDILAEIPSRLGSVKVNGTKLDCEVLMIEILNTRFIGPALPLGPRSALGDQLFDLMYLLPESRSDMLEWLDRPDRAPSPLKVIQGRKVDIRWERHDLHIDDRAWPPPAEATRVKARLEGSVPIWVPKAST